MSKETKPDIVGVIVRMPRSCRERLKDEARLADLSLEEYVRKKLGIPKPGTVEWMRAVVEGGLNGSAATEET